MNPKYFEELDAHRRSEINYTHLQKVIMQYLATEGCSCCRKTPHSASFVLKTIGVTREEYILYKQSLTEEDYLDD